MQCLHKLFNVLMYILRDMTKMYLDASAATVSQSFGYGARGHRVSALPMRDVQRAERPGRVACDASIYALIYTTTSETRITILGVICNGM